MYLAFRVLLATSDCALCSRSFYYHFYFDLSSDLALNL